MAVYVDGLREWGWRLGKSCHLIADTEEELHAFAARIGLRRAWAQGSRSGIPHYDLTVSRRERAIAAGAVDCAENHEPFVMVSRKWRERKAQG